MKNNKELTVIIAEDDDGHAELIREALEDAGMRNPILRFADGQSTWDFLKAQSMLDEFHKSNYLLLLDINMPKMDGVEVLKKVKAHNELRKIPVIVVTTTDDPREVEQCYALGCSVYIKKPVDFNSFSETLKRLGLFMQIIEL